MANIANIVRQHINQARSDGVAAVVTELEALLPAASGEWQDLDFQIQKRITAIAAEVDSLFGSPGPKADDFWAAVRQLDARRGALEGLSGALPA
jgi:hypothetical protein